MREDIKLLTPKSELEEYEAHVMASYIDHLEKNINEAASHLNDACKIEDAFYTAVSKHVGYSVNEGNLESIKITYTALWEVYADIDEILGKKECLIRPSHYLLPYALIKRKPDLREFIPIQQPRSGLELLSDKSTSRAMEIISEYSSENTYRAHVGDLIYFQAWLSAVGFTFTKPISDQDILTFIVQHAEGINPEIDAKLVSQGYKSNVGPHKLATIKRRIASLSVFLESAKLPNPVHSKDVKLLLSKLTKKYGASRPSGKAITKDILDDMLDTCKEKLIDIRDKSLLLFTWGSGGRRRSEVTSADIKNLTKTADGEFTYTIPKSKTDQEGKGFVVPVKGKVAKALNDWLGVSGITEGKIFRSVNKWGHIGRPLSDIDVNRIVKDRLKKAGYDKTQFNAHSLRSGFVTEAGKRQKPLGDVMAMTTHKNVGTVMKYYQSGNIINNSAANLAD